MQVKKWTLALVAGSLVTLSACSNGDDDQDSSPTGGGEEETTTATEDPAATTAPATDDAEVTTAPAEQAGLAPVPCEGAEEPSELEESLLVEAAPFSGESFDAEAAAEAVIAQDPSSDQEWAEAITAQIQGDYAGTVCEMMLFSADLGDGDAGPTAEEPDDAVVGENHFAVVLDASGSMAAEHGGQTQMDQAKSAIRSFVDELPTSSTVSLRIYGHEGDNSEAGRAESCESSEVIYEGAPDDDGFGATLDGVEPVGWTPLGKAIEDSQGDVPESATDAIMYVVSDGLETCGGDPVAAAGDVAASGINPIINVIGFHVDNADQAALREIADAGGGEFTTADSAQDLEAYWAQERERMRVAWLEWRDAEIERLQQARRDKVEEVTTLADGMRSAVGDDNGNTYAILGELRSQDAIDNEQRATLESLVTDHFSEARDYATEFRSNVRTAGENYLGGFREAYESASSTWRDYYAD